MDQHHVSPLRLSIAVNVDAPLARCIPGRQPCFPTAEDPHWCPGGYGSFPISSRAWPLSNKYDPHVIDIAFVTNGYIPCTDMVRCDPDRAHTEGIPEPHADARAHHRDNTVWHALGSIPCNTVCLTYTVPRACQTPQMEQMMSAKRHQIPQMVRVKAMSKPGETDNGAPWCTVV